MKSVVTALQRIGGPASVTWAAFWISLIDRVIANGIPQVGIVRPPFAVRLPHVCAAQVVMFVPLVLLWSLQQWRPKSRPVLTVLAFLLAVVIRGWSVDLSLHVFVGTPLAAGQRIFGSIYTVMLILLGCAYVANTLRERREELNNLLQVRREYEYAHAAAEESVQVRNDELVRDVRSILEEEVRSLEGRQPLEAVTSLRRTASEVIRPLSHALADSLAARRQPIPSLPHVRTGWRVLVADVATKRPFHPVLTALALSGSLISVAAVVPGFGWTSLLSLGVVAIVLGACNGVLDHLLPDRGPIARLLLVAAAGIAAGVAVGVFIWLTVGPTAWATTVAPASVYYVTVVSTSIAWVSSLLASRDELLAKTAMANEQLRRQLVRTRQLDWFHQRALAEALHGPLQSAVEAAAYRLDEQAAESSLALVSVEGVRSELLRSLDVLDSPEAGVTSLATGVARVAATWEGLCDVTLRTEGGAEAALDEDPISRSCALAIVTEGVSNSVRHGKAKRVEVLVRRIEDTLVIDVADDGAGRVDRPVRGLGAVFLDQCTLTWSLSEGAYGHRLHAQLPCRITA